MQVIGIGAQDNQSMAVDFVKDNGTTSFPMLWDPSGASWAGLGVAGQPAWLVVAPNGKLSSGGYGGIDENLVVEIASAFADEFGTNPAS